MLPISDGPEAHTTGTRGGPADVGGACSDAGDADADADGDDSDEGEDSTGAASVGEDDASESGGDTRPTVPPATALDSGAQKLVTASHTNADGGDTSGAPVSKKHKASRAAGCVAPERLTKYEGWRFVLNGKPHIGAVQFPYDDNRSYVAFRNFYDVLDDASFYTDETACVMDAFNLGVGRPVLSRENINVPFDADADGIKYEHMKDQIQSHGFDLNPVWKGKKKHKVWPTMSEVLGFESGVFLVEFFWSKPGHRGWHAVAVNCDQRRVMCNTLGGIPFQAQRAHESATTHAEIKRDLHVISVYRVYRIVRAARCAVPPCLL